MIRTAGVDGRDHGALQILCHYLLWVKVILADFNLVFNAKLPNLNFLSNFRLYGSYISS